MSKQSINKILFIDDSADYQQLLSCVLKLIFTDAEVDLYDLAIGKPALSFNWHSYDLLFLDYDLGHGENGLEWLREYKTTSGFPPTIILTAADDQELVVNAIRYGAQGFLRKADLNEKKLRQSVNIALERFAQEAEWYGKQKLRVHNYNKEKLFGSIDKSHANYAVYLVEIDNYSEIQEKLGIFGSKNFVTFISESFTKFIANKKIDAHITRISNPIIAILVRDIPDIDVSGGLAIDLCKYFNNIKYEHDDNKIEFTINIGVFHNHTGTTDINEVLTHTEAARREAKEIEGNSFILKSDEEDVTSGGKLLFEDKIEAAIKEDRVQTLFQPLVHVSDSSDAEDKYLYQTRSNIIDENNNIID